MLDYRQPIAREVKAFYAAILNRPYFELEDGDAAEIGRLIGKKPNVVVCYYARGWQVSFATVKVLVYHAARQHGDPGEAAAVLERLDADTWRDDPFVSWVFAEKLGG